VTLVWLPEPPERIEPLKSLPAGIEADVWTGTETLPESKDEVEFIVVPFGTKPAAITAISRLPRLKVIQLLSAGAEQVRPYVPEHITLCNARGAHDTATAEWTVGAIVAHLRKFPRFIRAQEAREWDWAPSEPLAGKRVLIVGYGSIGAAVERRLAGWEVTIDRVARSPRDGVHPIEDLPALLPGADVVVILVPVTDETRHLVNAQFLATMKDNALLVNAARGVIVDTDALLKELASARIRAALDVTDPEPLLPGHPLWQAPGLLLTPHVAGSLTDATVRAYQVVSDQLARFAAGEPLLNVIGARGY
jgi:phosphoglycerate dehydrogenase-like enzyme